MYTVKITFPVAEWTALRTALKNVPTAYAKKVDEEIAGFKSEVLAAISKYPPAAKEPTQWTPSRHPEDRNKRPNVYGFGRPYYSRQAAAARITRNWGGGIPYKRSLKLQKSWDVVRRGNQFVSQIIATNSDPKFKFVLRPYQQQFHRNTGWQSPDAELNRQRGRIRRRITRLAVLTVQEAVASKFRGKGSP